MNKKKYLKIGFISIFILFIIFVIVRKINMDRNLEQAQEKKKEEAPRIIKEKKPNIEIQEKLNDTTSVINDKITPVNEIIEEKKETHENEDTNSISENLSTTSIEKTKKPQEPVVTEIKLENISTEDNISEKTIDKIIKKITDKKDEPTVEIVEKVDEPIIIKTIDQLKNIKNQITIDSNQKSFSYKKNKFEVNDKFGDFKIINIYNKKIRFKINNNYYYSLRFYK